MARRGFSLQCSVIMAMVLVAVLALLSYPYQSNAKSSAKFRHGPGRQDKVVVLDGLDISNNATYENSLTKRAMAPMSTVDEAFAAMVVGCRLTDLMFASQDTVVQQMGPAGVSKWDGTDAAAVSSRWTRKQLSGTYDPTNIAPFLIGLNNVEEFTYHGIAISTDQNWWHTEYTQGSKYSRTVNDYVQEYPPTFGTHEQVSSTKRNAGVIIILQSFAPGFMRYLNTGTTPTDGELPLISLWSDIGYLEYARIGGFLSWTNWDNTPSQVYKGSQRKPPRWIVIPVVWGPDYTLSIISYCLYTTFGMTTMPADWTTRATFPIGSFCFEAILATPQGSALAWFLINHKFRLGEATVASISIFDSGTVGSNGYSLPTMLAWIIPITERSNVNMVGGAIPKDLTQIRAENQAYRYNNPNFDPTDYPHMLRAIRYT